MSKDNIDKYINGQSGFIEENIENENQANENNLNIKDIENIENIKDMENTNDIENPKNIKDAKDTKNIKDKRSFINDWLIPIVIAFILAALVQKFVLFKVRIPSPSMVPTLNVKDRLYVTRVYNPENLERGDIVVFHSKEKNEDMIKRLIGLPGDEVIINKGVVTVNGKQLKEDYLGEEDEFTGTFNVPKNKYFFLGDNRLWSSDSRYWQNPYIDEDDITAKAQLKVYPFDDIGWIK